MGIRRSATGRRLRAGAAAALAAAVLAAGCSSGGDQTEPRPKEASGSAAPTPESRWNTAPGSIAALGDSITTGFHACSLLSDCPESSWSTGSDPAVKSLAGRLLDRPEGKTWNLAKTGAVVSELPGQASRAVAHKPELVTVLIGANDACTEDPAGMTSAQDFERDVTRAVKTLRDGLPTTQIFVVSVPDLSRLWDQGRTEKAARDVWQLGICQSMLRDPQSVTAADEQRRAAVVERVDAYNGILKKVCTADERCRHDGGVVGDYPFTQAELSQWDWFHPNKRGQHVLARLVHRAVTARG